MLTIIITCFALIFIPVCYADNNGLKPPAAAEKRDGVVDKIQGSLTRPYATLSDVEVEGKTVLVRIDVNVLAEGGHIEDIGHPHARVVAAAETLKELSDKGAKVVVIFHQGRPGEPDFMDTPLEHAKQMSALLGRKVSTVDDLFGPKAVAAIKALKPGEILFLKPVRAQDPLMLANILEENPYFTAVLRPLIDLFVLDGFSVAHRDSNSVTGFKGVPTVAGKLMDGEVKGNTETLTPPRFLAVGGGKLADKFLGLVGQVKAGRADKVLIGGRLANLLLVAMQPGAGELGANRRYDLAVKVLGKATADDLQKEGLNLLPEMVELLTKFKDRFILIQDMVYLDEQGKRQVVELKDGKVPEGFNFLLKGIGPQTVQEAVNLIQQGNFQSGYLMGPLTDSRINVLLEDNRSLLEAFGEHIKFWGYGGGDTGVMVNKLELEFKPWFVSLAGSASGEYLAGSRLPGVELVRNNQPDRLKPYVPADSGEAQALAHTRVLGTLAQVLDEAGATVYVRTNVFYEGGRVDAARFIKVPLSTAVLEALRKSLGKEAMRVFAGFETILVDAQNPWINFTISNIYTPDNRPLNPAPLRRALAENKDVALILVPKSGDIDTKKLADTLEKILNWALRQKGVDAQVIKEVVPRALPAIAQITQADIPSELKLAVVVPAPGSEVYRLMQLAQDAGINLKELLEKEFPVARDAKGVQAEAKLAQEPLLGELPAFPKPVIAEAEVRPQAPSPLAGLILGRGEINEALQTFFVTASALPTEIDLTMQIREIKSRALETGKVVRIVVRAGSPAERQIENMLEATKEETKDLTTASHLMLHNGLRSRAFLIRPTKHAVLVGYGNEAIKLAPVYEKAGYRVAVAIHSLSRAERVVHAFFMGYPIYFTDKAKDKAGNIITVEDNSPAFIQFTHELLELLTNACTARARGRIYSAYPESQRLERAQDVSIENRARNEGRAEAGKLIASQFKGALSKALLAGEFDVVDDASSEGSGADNRELLYEPAISANPNKRMVFLYQGGEKERVGNASFSTITADFDKLAALQHVRHVSCNTTGLSSIVTPILEALRDLEGPIDLDNTAFRRGQDPGDLRAGAASVTMQTGYHHFPDLLSVLPEAVKPLVRGNTDAAQIGTNLRFHFHMLYLRRTDGKPFDKRMVQRIQAAQSRVALVDFPGGIFDSTRITEIAHNLLPQQVDSAPDGANHLLVPVLFVQETDDPAQLRLIYAVPQESIVAPGNVNAVDALLGMASKDASMAIINDETGLTEIVAGIEARLPVKSLDQQPAVVLTDLSVSAAAPAPAAPAPAAPFRQPLGYNPWITNTAKAMGLDQDKLVSFIAVDEGVFTALAGVHFEKYLLELFNIATQQRPKVLAVSTSSLKAGGATTVLSRVAAQLNRTVKVALYGKNAEKLMALLGAENVITAGSAAELLGKLTRDDIAGKDVVAVSSASEAELANTEVRQVIAKEASPLVLAKALKELLNDSKAEAAFSEFFARAQEAGAVSQEAYLANKETVLAELQEGIFDFPDDLKPSQQVSDQIAKDAQAVAEFIDQF